MSGLLGLLKSEPIRTIVFMLCVFGGPLALQRVMYTHRKRLGDTEWVKLIGGGITWSRVTRGEVARMVCILVFCFSMMFLLLS